MAMALALTTTPPAATAVPALPDEPAQVDEKVQSFLSTLKAGKGNEAVEALLSSSPLWDQRPGASEQMVGQIDAAIKAYGPVVSYEKLPSTTLGTMAVRQYYLVQHREMVTRWEFHLVRTARGWSVGYFGFSDQPTGWFS
ncbi:hypothetical protein [Sphingomonas sp.]